MQALEKLQELLSEIKTLEDTLKGLKTNGVDFALDDVASQCPADQVQETVNMIYWDMPTISAARIKESFVPDLKVHEWRDFILPRGTGKQCADCGVEFLAQSREHMKQINAYGTSKTIPLMRLEFHGDEDRPDGALCPDCINARRERNKERMMQDRAYKLKVMPYKEYLKTPEWAMTREACIERAGGKCQLCNSGGFMYVHHRSYESRGAEKDTDLIALCRNCHERFHKS